MTHGSMDPVYQKISELILNKVAKADPRTQGPIDKKYKMLEQNYQKILTEAKIRTEASQKIK